MIVPFVLALLSTSFAAVQRPRFNGVEVMDAPSFETRPQDIDPGLEASVEDHIFTESQAQAPSSIKTPVKNSRVSKLSQSAESELPFYYPKTQFEAVVDTKGPVASTNLQTAQLAHSAMVKTLGIKPSELRITSQFVDHMNVTHVYMNRMVGDVAVSNHNAAVHIKNGHITAYTASFKGDTQVIMPSKVTVSLAAAVTTAEKQFGAPKEDIEAYFSYLEDAKGELVYCHNFQLRDDDKSKWLHVSVNAQTGLFF
jgi:Zn-dependent metalloprotease